jgi:hypothetical protein
MRQAVVLLFLLAPVSVWGQAGTVSNSAMNPAISVIGDMRGNYHDYEDRKVQFQFEEAELSLLSSIDPYARADFYLSFSRNQDGEYVGGLEEGYLTTLSLPFDLRLKAGRFRLPVGRINPLHPHALPFSDMPAPVVAYLGEEGLIDDGVTVNWLIPNPFDFYQEIELGVSNVSAESPLFAPPEAGRYLYIAHLKNFWETDENTTLEFGLSGLTGPNHLALTSSLGAADLTLKWKPLQMNRYKSLVWQSEIFFSRYGIENGGALESWGLYSYLTYQIGEQWFLTGRFDYANPPLSPEIVDRALSGTIGWYATEFQKIELGGKMITSNIAQDRTEFTLRWIFVIGAHGAHQY